MNLRSLRDSWRMLFVFLKSGMGTLPFLLSILLTFSPVAANQKLPKPSDSTPSTSPIKEHIVKPNETLSELSIRYYGTPFYWLQIAHASGVRPPYRLEPGSRLILPYPVTLSAEEGARTLLDYYRIRLNRRNQDYSKLSRSNPATPNALSKSEAPPQRGSDDRSRPPQKATAAAGASPSAPSTEGRTVASIPNAAVPAPLPSKTPEQVQLSKQKFLTAFGENDEVLASRPKESSAVNQSPPPKVAPQPVSPDQTEEEWAAEKNYQTGSRLLESGSYEQALKLLSRAREQNPDESTHWIYEIRCLQKLNKRPEAKKVATSFVDKFPDFGFLPSIQAALKGEKWVEPPPEPEENTDSGGSAR